MAHEIFLWVSCLAFKMREWKLKLVRVFYHKQHFYIFQFDPHYNPVKWVGRLDMIIPILQYTWVHSRRSVVSNLLRPQRLGPTRLLCPWNFPGKNTVVCCHFLLQGDTIKSYKFETDILGSWSDWATLYKSLIKNKAFRLCYIQHPVSIPYLCSFYPLPICK